ncbi:MAG: helix-turn-helix transcriptional regulator [Bacteroidales bacterium]
MKREDLLRNKGYWMSKIQIDLFRQLSDYMSKNRLTRTQLAKKLGVSKGYISQIMNGDFNHRLSTLVELSLAMEKIPELKFSDLRQFIEDESKGIKRVSWTIEINKATTTESAKFENQTEPLESTTDFNAQSTIQNQIVNFS